MQALELLQGDVWGPKKGSGRVLTVEDATIEEIPLPADKRHDPRRVADQIQKEGQNRTRTHQVVAKNKRYSLSQTPGIFLFIYIQNCYRFLSGPVSPQALINQIDSYTQSSGDSHLLTPVIKVWFLPGHSSLPVCLASFC